MDKLVSWDQNSPVVRSDSKNVSNKHLPNINQRHRQFGAGFQMFPGLPGHGLGDKTWNISYHLLTQNSATHGELFKSRVALGDEVTLSRKTSNFSSWIQDWHRKWWSNWPNGWLGTVWHPVAPHLQSPSPGCCVFQLAAPAHRNAREDADPSRLTSDRCQNYSMAIQGS